MLTISLDPDRNVRLTSAVEPQEVLCLQFTKHPADPFWATLCTNMADCAGLYSVVDWDSTNHPIRFYRLAPAP